MGLRYPDSRGPFPIDWDVINRDHCSRLVVVALTCDFHMIWKNTSDTKASAAVVKN